MGAAWPLGLSSGPLVPCSPERANSHSSDELPKAQARCLALAQSAQVPTARNVRRPIRAGEECCISYLNPPLQSLVRRAVHLEKQHFFSPATPVAAAANPKHQPRQLQQPAPPCPSAPAPPALRGAPPQKVHPPLAHFLPEPSNAFPTEMDAWQGHEVSYSARQADLPRACIIDQGFQGVEAADQAF